MKPFLRKKLKNRNDINRNNETILFDHFLNMV